MDNGQFIHVGNGLKQFLTSNRFEKGKFMDIQSLAQEIIKIKKHADELGLFTHDRDLLECKFCGLMEDVTFEGNLITFIKREDIEYNKMKNSSKRFIETNDPNIFICPQCGNNTELPEVDFE